MASTARSKSEKKEYFDPPDVLERKVDQLAQWISESKHMIAFTGAGISTAAGIPDFRSGMDTTLSTGPGVWELKANSKGSGKKVEKKGKVTLAVKALPTPTHMMLVKLHEEGILKCCVSQNVDGLHRRSGLPKSALAELHGNTNMEICKSCGREYLRDFRVRNARRVTDHKTGRKCDNPQCRGILCDTIINFGESLPDSELSRGTMEGDTADLCLAMGSSLTVTPAADIPECVADRGKRLVIVNLQKTPLHGCASLCIHAKCEDVSQMVMAKLGLEIPEFRLKRRVLVKWSHDQRIGSAKISLEGQDQYGFYFSFLKDVCVTIKGQSHQLQEPFELPFPWRPATSAEEMTVQVMLQFQGHYGEPPVTRDVKIRKGKKNEEKLLLSFDPVAKVWDITVDTAATASVLPVSEIASLSLEPK